MKKWMEKKWISNGLWLLGLGIALFLATQLPMVALSWGVQYAWSDLMINVCPWSHHAPGLSPLVVL